MQKESIIVVGFGWVGQANALALSLDGYDVAFYDINEPDQHYKEYLDIYKKFKQLKAPLEIDGPNAVYVICVGDRVDDKGNQDISLIRTVLDPLKDARGTVVLRSTIIPDYLKELDFDVYLPEFLHEKAAVKECVNPQYVVVGKKKDTSVIPSFIELWRKRSVKQMDCSPEAAAHVKYLSNFWNALRIAFVNEFGSSIEAPKDTKAIGRIDEVMDFIFSDELYGRFGRGFGGHCLPKDTRAYTRWNENNAKSVPLMRGLVVSNDEHVAREKNYPDLKEWFSNWKEPAGSGWVALHILGKSIKRNVLHPMAALKRRKTVEYRKTT